LDDCYVSTLNGIAEFRLMREASPEYHVVKTCSDNGGTQLLCRDLRVRNFGTRFGDLEVWLDSNGRITRSHFHA
jgi:hypothetical protein